jgi:hypothetical protein
VRIASMVIAGTMLCASAAAVAGQTPSTTVSSPTPTVETKGKIADPDKIICEKQEVLGSRIAVRRVCMTRAQWADQRAQDRQEIDKVQTRRTMNGE